MKKILIITLLGIYNTLMGQEKLPADSLNISNHFPPTEVKYTHNQLIAPIGLISLGVVSKMTNANDYVQQWVSNNVSGKIKVDDYTQYVPALGVFLMSNLGFKAKHSVTDRVLITAMAYGITGTTVLSSKYLFGVQRPDKSAYNSFPSGHTAVAFTGAEILWQEYKEDNIWIGIGGYAIASFTGLMRIYNNRHWLVDVLAGAGYGIFSARLSYWLSPYVSEVLFPKKWKTKVTFYPIYSKEMKGMGSYVSF